MKKLILCLCLVALAGCCGGNYATRQTGGEIMSLEEIERQQLILSEKRKALTVRETKSEKYKYSIRLDSCRYLSTGSSESRIYIEKSPEVDGFWYPDGDNINIELSQWEKIKSAVDEILTGSGLKEAQ